jgi:glycosyltransferase involved in cell wall biosynthesis
MPLRASLDQQAEPLVSVIIPCYNSERTIRQCLTAIFNQRTGIPFEVVVVDSSTDSTAKIVEEEFPAARLIHLARRTFAGAARNVGIRATQSPYCLMIDSDCVASADVLERVFARHQEAEYAAVGGALANGTPQSVSGWIGYLIEFKEFMPTTPKRLEKSIPTAIIAYRRAALERHGCFDDDMWLAEDILLNWRMVSAGERLLFDPLIAVTHLNRTGWSEVLSYQVSLGRLSAVARRRGGLPGMILLDYPVLVLLMPFVRLLNAVKWLASIKDKQALSRLLWLWPLYLLAATFWSYGFLQEALNRTEETGK